MAKSKVPLNDLEAIYLETKSVWRTAERVGLCGQSVHERLTRAGLIKPVTDEFSKTHQKLIIAAYERDFKRGDGVLEDLANITGKSAQNICRWAKRNGLTNNRRSTAAELAATRGKQVSEAFKKNGHPRGMRGKKHSAATKQRLSETSALAAELRLPEVEKSRVLKGLQTKAANGTLYAPRGNVTWKGGWRVIGGKRTYYRSRWEANYARYLEFLKSTRQIKDWEHEPETFWFEKIMRGTRSYLPDFRVTRLDGSVYYVEVKGYMDSKSKTKLKRMKKYHPKIELQLVDSEQYKSLKKTFSSTLLGWE